MAVDKQIKQLQQQKLTRKEFLTQMGAVGLAVVGVNSIIHFLGSVSHQDKGAAGVDNYPGNSAAQADGYGDMPYGGD